MYLNGYVHHSMGKHEGLFDFVEKKSSFHLRFSALHNKSQFLNDPKAKVFYWVLAAIAATGPALAVLENVLGILRERVWKKVACLHYWKGFLISTTAFNFVYVLNLLF